MAIDAGENSGLRQLLEYSCRQFISLLLLGTRYGNEAFAVAAHEGGRIVARGGSELDARQRQRRQLMKCWRWYARWQ
jgi:hypothetical protein